MPTVKVDWLKNRTFVGTDGSGHSVVLSGDDEAVGVRPSQMLLVALAACTGYDVVAIMEKKRKPLSKLEITVEGNQQEESPTLTGTFMSPIGSVAKTLPKKPSPRPFSCPKRSTVRWPPPSAAWRK